MDPYNVDCSLLKVLGSSVSGDLKVAPALAPDEDESPVNSCRYVHVGLSNGSLVLKSLRPYSDEGPQAAFDNLVDEMDDQRPSFVIFRTDERSNSPTWSLFCWLPENLTEGDQWEFSIARNTLETLVNSMGVSPLEVTVCSDKADFSFEKYVELRKRTVDICSAKELDVLNYNLQSRPSVAGKASSPGYVTVTATNTLRKLLRNFTGDREAFSICMSFRSRKSTVLDGEAFPSGPLSALATRVHQREPRYYLVRYPTSRNTLFVLSTPEGSPKPLRPFYAANKAAVLALVQNEDIEVEKSIDVRNSATDLSDTHVSQLPEYRRPFQDPKALTSLSSNWPYTAYYLPQTHHRALSDQYASSAVRLRPPTGNKHFVSQNFTN